MKVNAVKSLPHLKTHLSQSASKAANIATASIHAIGQQFLQRSKHRHLENTTLNVVNSSQPQPQGPPVPLDCSKVNVELDPVEPTEPLLEGPGTTSESTPAHELAAIECQAQEVMATAALVSLQERLWAGISRAATVKDTPDDDNDEIATIDSDDEDPVEALVSETGDWGLEIDDDEYIAVSALDRLRERFTRQVCKPGAPKSSLPITFLLTNT